MSLRTGWIERHSHERKAVSWNATYQVIGAEEAADLSGECRRPSPQAPEKGNREVFKAVTRNLSEGGLAVVGAQDLAAGTKLLLYIHQPEPPSLVVVAEVVHSMEDSSPGNSLHRSGMRILAVDENSLRRLLELL